jgi:EAL domain-containing protein (putative c-di-GMP-specific phosphodiesterase class I)
MSLFTGAELALMAAKRHGGGCARVYQPGLEDEAPADAVALEADLRQALERGELDIHYQPIMRLSNQSVAGFEALLRWQHPEKGLISPADFIAHSETSGLIVALGKFALERAAADLAHWQRYFPVNPPLFVSVNLSRRQLRDPGFEDILAKVIKRVEIAPGTLRLEVTESAVGSDAQLSAMLPRLRALGAGLSIDDFGTGSSSLSQFRSLPFDTVKIDKSFLVSHAGGADPDAGRVLSSIIALAHDLNRAVVVEGVESAEDVAWLKGLGCEYGQGYFFAPALPGAEALTFIAKHYDVAAAAS